MLRTKEGNRATSRLWTSAGVISPASTQAWCAKPYFF